MAMSVDVFNDEYAQQLYGFVGTDNLLVDPLAVVTFGFLWGCPDIWWNFTTVSTSWSASASGASNAWSAGSTSVTTGWTLPSGDPWGSC